jgi:hypothetical protein
MFTYFIGRKYGRMKKASAGRADRTLSGDHFDHPKTADIIATEHGVSAPTVRRAEKFATSVIDSNSQ